MMTVQKPKLPKGLSYVLKTFMLQTALDQAHIECHVDLVYWKPQSSGSVLEAHYWLPNANVAYPQVYVRAGVVRSSERRVALEALADVILPEFIVWLTHILALPEKSPLLKGKSSNDDLYFNAIYVEGLTGIRHNFLNS